MRGDLWYVYRVSEGLEKQKKNQTFRHSVIHLMINLGIKLNFCSSILQVSQFLPDVCPLSRMNVLGPVKS